MSDLNKEALDIWGGLKPMIDQEISSRTQGMVQRRKAKVTTAPSLATNTIGVTEAFGQEIFLPFVSNMISAKVGDFVWIEWMYGATNAFVSSYAAVDDKNLTVAGTLDVVQRRCEATLSSAGWYRVCKIANIGRGDYSFAIDLNICRQFYYANNEQHGIRLIVNWDSCSFVNENSKSNTQIIKRIRYTVDSNNNGYVDIYYEFSNANIVYCEIAVHGMYPERYTIESLQGVDPSPSGETVLQEYTFAANTYYHDNGVTNGVRHIVDRRGDIVTVTIESGGSGINCPAGQYTTVYTLSSDLSPAASVYTVVDTYGGNNIIGGIINTSGEIQIYPVLSSTSYYRFTLTYTLTK